MQYFCRRNRMTPRQKPTYAQKTAQYTRRKPLLDTPRSRTPRRTLLTGGFTTPPRQKRSSVEKPLAISEDLFPVSRLHFKIIKCRHHLSTLCATAPKSLTKTAAELQSNLHPAFITENFKSAAKTAADTWLSSVVDALLCHYESEINSAASSIRECHLSQDSLDKCLSVATTWARRQLGRKLSDSDLEDSLERIRALTPLPISDAPQTPPRQTTQKP